MKGCYKTLRYFAKGLQTSLLTMESYKMHLNREGTLGFSYGKMALAKVWRVGCRV